MAEKKYSLENPRGSEIGRRGAPYVVPVDAPYDSERGLRFSPVFSNPAVGPFDWDPHTGQKIEYDLREASITDDKGKVIFKQKDVEVPKNWSMLATNVVASKYLYGDPVVEGDREHSVASLVDRVARTITDLGVRDGYFASQEDAQTFYKELVSLNLNQFGSFNSPVWFNTGLFHQYGVGKTSSAGNFYFDKSTGEVKQAATQYEKPQVSACFIQHVEDTMEDIMELARSEAMLFKFGSGSGTDLSTLRSTREKLSGGGRPSGPLSFLKIYDSVASVVKSGGKTRRAAKMNTLKDWHPDIKEFIEAKPRQEMLAGILIDAGIDGNFNGEAYSTVAFQNENLSVRVTDEFMKAVIEDKDWTTHWVTDPSKPGPIYRARELLEGIAKGTWVCGDPGLQFEDTIQKWHTAKKSGRINSSNPCSEYMFLDDTACNLASLNLHRFLKQDGSFDVDRFKHAVDVFITAQEIVVDNASYPTQDIARNSHIYRTLGLGYANLGGLLMSQGIPYDSEQGRQLAKAVTALMHNRAYVQSARIAKSKGAFEGYEENKEPMLEVVKAHKEHTEKIRDELIPGKLRNISLEARLEGERALAMGVESGYRNAQVTVLAPTGTIGFMMDADTTGVEPDIALVKYKTLAGGGMLKIVNRMVQPALEKLGYSQEQIEKIVKHIDEQDTIEGAPELKAEHLPVFDCAFKPRNGQRFISYTAHVDMMAAVQPHLSGAISKTVNMPNEATPQQIFETYIDGWKKGLKALAIYRDGSKKSQPVNMGLDVDGGNGNYAILVRDGKTVGLRPLGEEDLGNLEKVLVGFKKKITTSSTELSEVSKLPTPIRERLPQHRLAMTSKYEIAGEHEVYITTGFYEDGRVGETFLTAAKEGSYANGMADVASTFISMVLQHGVPVEKVAQHLIGMSFEPSGFVAPRNGGLLSALIEQPIQGQVTSVADLLGRHLLLASQTGKKLSSKLYSTPQEQKSEKKEEDAAAPKKSNGVNAGWIHICKICGAPAKDTDNKCGRVCQKGHMDQSGCSG